MWDKGGKLTTLPLPDWEQYSVDRGFAVDDEGTVVGNATGYVKNPTTGGNQQVNDAFRWDADNGFQKLAPLTDNRTLTEPLAVNASGVVVGTSGDDAFVLKPGGTMTRLPDFGFSAKALKVNDAGWIIGTAETEPDADAAVVWDSDGRMYALSAMVDSAHWTPTEGIGINNRGQAAFYATDRTDQGTTKVVVATLPH
ncbi:hypothetical protein [Streptomyces sp. NPDC059639]|uniref:hypothetical protein n=1 Tax=Streptomyces sp. NPDC059639 TaxID=3346891 RepID=UPI0036961E2F